VSFYTRNNTDPNISFFVSNTIEQRSFTFDHFVYIKGSLFFIYSLFIIP
jgi:hypothetical protein